MRFIGRLLLLLLLPFTSVAAQSAQMDPDNPTCPKKPNWTANREMKLSVVDRDGIKVILAEGIVDQGVPGRLKKILDENPEVSEIWLRSPGGSAYAGNEAGRIIRKAEGFLITRIPAGWTCFSACNFIFMGGRARIVEPGGNFMVHMFTMTGQRDIIDETVSAGLEDTIELIGAIEQESAMLATEDNDFLIRMGVSRKLLTDIMYRQQAVAGEVDRSTRRCLTIEEAYRYNVANVRE